MSVHPRFASAILDGAKTVELRRRRAALPAGSFLVLYSSSPEKAVVGTVRLAEVATAAPERLWRAVATSAGVTRSEYTRYTAGASSVSALHLRDPRRLPRPLPLATLRTAHPAFTAPQSYRYLGTEELKALASTGASGAELLQRAIEAGAV